MQHSNTLHYIIIAREKVSIFATEKKNNKTDYDKEKQYDNNKNRPIMPSSLSDFIFNAARTEGCIYG